MSFPITFVGLAAFFYAFIIAYLLIGLLRSSSPLSEESHQPLVSVVVAARNEEKNIERSLEALAQQEYPADLLEIIVVDDRSGDKTWQIIESIARRFRSIQAARIEATGSWASAKKNALSTGIARAKGSILLFTDADCVPPLGWVKNIVRQYSPGIGMIAGFSPQCASGKTVWNGFLFIDSLASALVAAGSIGWGNGVTCTGRNLSCLRQTMNDIGDYNAFPDSVSGDDDFLLQAISRHPAWKAAYSFARGSQVPAAGPDNLRRFLQQKRRHISSGKYLGLNAKIGYGLYHFSNFTIWLIAILGAYKHAFFPCVLIFKIFLDWTALKAMAHKLGVNYPLSHFFAWELLFPIYHLASGPSAFWGKISWKPDQERPA